MLPPDSLIPSKVIPLTLPDFMAKQEGPDAMDKRGWPSWDDRAKCSTITTKNMDWWLQGVNLHLLQAQSQALGQSPLQDLICTTESKCKKCADRIAKGELDASCSARKHRHDWNKVVKEGNWIWNHRQLVEMPLEWVEELMGFPRFYTQVRKFRPHSVTGIKMFVCAGPVTRRETQTARERRGHGRGRL